MVFTYLPSFLVWQHSNITYIQVALELKSNVYVPTVFGNGIAVTYPLDAIKGMSLIAGKYCECVDVVLSRVEGYRTLEIHAAGKARH